MLNQIIKGNTPVITVSPCDPSELFPEFHASDSTQYDEGIDRSSTLGKNPNVKTDCLGDTNVVCREVLYRFATKIGKDGNPKARYIGKEADPGKWIDDWENWEVSVKKSNDGPREFVKLGTPGVIQMGHKLSAVSYWVYGYNLDNPSLQKFFAEYKRKHGEVKCIEKKGKYAVRYMDYKIPGFMCVEAGAALTNRKFMYDSRNYRFEWRKLNLENGIAERKELKYADCFKRGATLTQLKIYRDKRKDKDTTPFINEDLERRKKLLAGAIKSNFGKLLKKP